MHDSEYDINTPIIGQTLGKIIKTTLCLSGGCLNENTFSQSVDLSGGAGETLVLSYFSCVSSTLSDIAVSYIKVNYTNINRDPSYHNFGDNSNLYRFNMHTIITEGNYDGINTDNAFLDTKTIYKVRGN